MFDTAADGAIFWVGEAFGGVEGLFAGRKNEFVSAVFANQSLIGHVCILTY